MMNSPRALLAVFGGPLAWFAQLMVGWMVGLSSCTPGSPARAVDLAVSAAAFAGALAAAAAGLRAARRDEAGALPFPLGRTRPAFLAEVSVLGGGLSALAIAITAAALVTVPLCGSMR